VQIVAADEKTRFALKTDEDGTLYIRANQGHTLTVRTGRDDDTTTFERFRRVSRTRCSSPA
jgi:RNA:NAD 2'-phosphotransferase (TPT1/KptA family)